MVAKRGREKRQFMEIGEQSELVYKWSKMLKGIVWAREMNTASRLGWKGN